MFIEITPVMRKSCNYVKYSHVIPSTLYYISAFLYFISVIQQKPNLPKFDYYNLYVFKYEINRKTLGSTTLLFFTNVSEVKYNIQTGELHYIKKTSILSIGNLLLKI